MPKLSDTPEKTKNEALMAYKHALSNPNNEGSDIFMFTDSESGVGVLVIKDDLGRVLYFVVAKEHLADLKAWVAELEAMY